MVATVTTTRIMIKRKRDERKVDGSVTKDRGDGGVGVSKGVAVTEFGVGDKREPVLGDAFEANQRSSWHAQ
jgi:hypothetical protein